MAARVFVVDAGEGSRFEVRKALASAGLELVGEAAPDSSMVVSAAVAAPDVVLYAVEAPGVARIQDITALREALPGTPIVVYSESADGDVERIAAAAGARSFLALPLEAASLRAAIDEAISTPEDLMAPPAEEVAPPAGPLGTLIAVYSSKGGAGKTTLAINLAVGLRLASRRPVALVGAPSDPGDLAVMMELDSTWTLRTLVGALADDPRTDPRAFMSAHASGVDVLAPAPGAIEGSSIEASSFACALESLQRAYDFVVVDLGVTLDAAALEALRMASVVLHVVTPSVVSVRGAARASSVMASHGIDLGGVRVVVNYIAPDRVSADAIEEMLGTTVYWTIPHDSNLHRNAEMGRAIDQSPRRGGAAGAILRLARQLAGLPPESRRALASLNVLALLQSL